MLLLAWLFRDHSHKEVILMVMVGGYFMATALIERNVRKLRSSGK
jgi:hypothetical protein